MVWSEATGALMHSRTRALTQVYKHAVTAFIRHQYPLTHTHKWRLCLRRHCSIPSNAISCPLYLILSNSNKHTHFSISSHIHATHYKRRAARQFKNYQRVFFTVSRAAGHFLFTVCMCVCFYEYV